MSANRQSILITVGKYQAYLNLSMYEEDCRSPFYGPIRKGTWSFMTTYPKKNDSAPNRVLAAFNEVTGCFYGSEAAAKSAVAALVRKLEASVEGWKNGFGGMPAAYIGERR